MLLPLRNLGAKHKLRWFSFCLCLSSLAPHPSPRGSPDPAPCVHTCDAGRDEGGRPCLSPRFPWKGAPLSQERGSGAGHWNLGRKVSATQNPSKVCPMSLRRCFQRQPVRLNTELSRPGAQQSPGCLRSCVDSLLERSRDRGNESAGPVKPRCGH